MAGGGGPAWLSAVGGLKNPVQQGIAGRHGAIGIYRRNRGIDCRAFGDALTRRILAKQCNREGDLLVAGRASMPGAQRKNALNLRSGRFQILGWLMGLEPTTTGITILDSTN